MSRSLATSPSMIGQKLLTAVPSFGAGVQAKEWSTGRRACAVRLHLAHARRRRAALAAPRAGAGFSKNTLFAIKVFSITNSALSGSGRAVRGACLRPVSDCSLFVVRCGWPADCSLFAVRAHEHREHEHPPPPHRGARAEDERLACDRQELGCNAATAAAGRRCGAAVIISMLALGSRACSPSSSRWMATA